ncbi:MAG: carbon-nitrogen hydrolase family protein, partial [Gammaproteobacteria bacterium]|nr:carbon-nitrogen hydrolase family protein [Gammaproteobacteria bacterium]
VLVNEAADRKPGIIFLPENFAALGADNFYEIGKRESGEEGYIRKALSEMASGNKCWISAGTIPVANRINKGSGSGKSDITDGRVRAASILFNDDGKEVARYDKIHMFDVDVADNKRRYRESDFFEKGDSLVVVGTPIGKLGLSVCYDIRFPELYRRLALAGAELLSIPSAFTRVTGEAHFSTLMRARAIENFCYTIAACQGGEHDSGRQTWGRSMVVSPWGEVLGCMELGEGVLEVEIDMNEPERIRKDMPVLEQMEIGISGDKPVIVI